MSLPTTNSKATLHPSQPPPHMTNPTTPPGDPVPPNNTQLLPTNTTKLIQKRLRSLPTLETTMTSSVPSVKDITNTFPTPITKIMGKPNYESLRNLKDQLKANATSIPTTLGGGNHGYLGLILSPTAYATIAANQFIEPVYPRQHPNVPAGTNATNTSTIVRCHTEDLRQWHEFKKVNTALKNQLLSTLDNIYVHALKDHHVRYMNQSIRTILTHLFNN